MRASREWTSPPRLASCVDPDGTLPWARRWFSGEVSTREDFLRALQEADVLVVCVNAMRLGPLGKTQIWLRDGKLDLSTVGDRLQTASPGLVLLDFQGTPGNPGYDSEEWIEFLLRRGTRLVVANTADSEETIGIFRRLADAFLARQSVAGLVRNVPFLGLHGEADLQLPATVQATAPSKLRPNFEVKVQQGPDQGRVFPVLLRPGQPVQIGRAGLYQNEIELSDPTLENRHATLEKTSEGVRLRRAGPVWVNGLAVMQDVLLHGGEQIRMGESLLSLGAFSGWKKEAGPIELALEVDQRRVPLQDATVTVGRSPDCTVSLDHPEVSRVHFSLTRREGSLFLMPLSSNPTLVNGVSVDREREVELGDRIQPCAEVEIRVVQA